MELFATLNVQRLEDKRAIERVMASRDKRWLASLGLKSSRNAQLPCSAEDGGDEEQVDPDAEMAALDEQMVGLALKTTIVDERPVRLTMKLIRESAGLSKKTKRRSRKSQGKEEEEEEKEVEALLAKKVLRLDWHDISKIENLDVFTHVEELYLQYNLIETIEGLDDHDHLTFLALAGNRIREVKNLKHLNNLKFLDLSMNYIEDFDVSEFPKSLRILRLAGNPFIRHMPAYAHLFFERMPNLVQVDQFRRTDATSPVDPKPNVDTDSLSTASSTDGSNTVVQSHVVIMPLPAPNSPMDEYRALQVEVELPQHEQELQEKRQCDDSEGKAEFNLADYEKERSDRMAKWKAQLTSLTTRTREQLAESSDSIKTSAKFRAKRSLALSRARQATDSALIDAASHFKQMELAHQDWQTQQRRPTPSQAS